MSDNPRMLQNCPRCWGEHDEVDCTQPETMFARGKLWVPEAEVERLREALASVQFDLLNCSLQDLCDHLKDAKQIAADALEEHNAR